MDLPLFGMILVGSTEKVSRSLVRTNRHSLNLSNDLCPHSLSLSLSLLNLSASRSESQLRTRLRSGRQRPPIPPHPLWSGTQEIPIVAGLYDAQPLSSVRHDVASAANDHHAVVRLAGGQGQQPT